MIDEFIKCPNCKATIQLNQQEQQDEVFKCPSCSSTFTGHNEKKHISINSSWSSSGTFTTKYKSHTIKVVVDYGKEVIVLVDDEVIVNQPYQQSFASEIQTVDFTIPENKKKIPMKVNVFALHGSTFHLQCEIYGNGKLLLNQESKGSKTIWYILIVFFLILILISILIGI
ncbi:MAG: hypothetical protein JNJ85_17020 [Candidatus Kapabacteria bacterium]|nr:hypothetical protein [Candidatus Kapabacteria bacterium]